MTGQAEQDYIAGRPTQSLWDIASSGPVFNEKKKNNNNVK